MEALLDVALPVFAIIASGYVAGRMGLLGTSASEALSKFVFYFALPPLLFLAMARAPVAQIFYWPFIGAYLGGQILTFAAALLVGGVGFRLSLAQRSLFGMAGMFGNTGYMGIPLVLTAFGEAATLPAVVATVINSAVIITLVVILIEADRTPDGRGMAMIADVLGALLRNPLLVAPVAGIIVGASGIALPVPLVTYAEILGAAAGPGALFAIGLFLVGKPVSQGLGEVGTMVGLKLAVQPLLTLALFIAVFPADPLWLGVGVLMAALPAGANVFVLAQRYGSYEARASSAILVSTAVSVVTVSVVLVWLAERLAG